ncbi:MAG: response regulator [Candidatus Nitrospinota bacterium M3_3B_026]
MRHRVLFVDDDANITDGLKRALRREPYETLTANSAEEAYRLMSEKEVDVVVSDEKMPRVSGTDFLSVVRRKFPETIRMMLTGHASLSNMKKAINEGEVYRFFTKPVNDIELAVAIHHALKQKDLMAEARRLLGLYRKQSSLIEKMEQEGAAIPRLDVDEKEETWYIEDEPSETDVDRLLKEIREETRKRAGGGAD